MRFLTNIPVIMSSNLINVYKRYTRRQAERNQITLDQGRVVLPSPPVSIYYSYQMWGVDVADMKNSNYSMEIRNRKWWMPCFLHYLNTVLGNVQIVHQMLTGNKISGKDLRIEISKQLIGNRSFRLTRGRKRTNLSVNSVNVE